LVSFCVTMLAFDSDDLKDFDMQPVEALLKQINDFVPFMLGYFVAVSLARWWQLRVNALGRVFDSFVNVSMFVACELNDEKWSDLHLQIVKYGIASIELLWQAARNEDCLQDLEKKGLLTEQEISGLARQTFFWQRPMTMWAWIMRICVAALDHNRSIAGLSNHVMKQCIMAREGMALINAHFDTQLPFAYVHLICLLVNLQNVVFAVVSGMHCAISYSTGNIHATVQQVCACLLIGVVYQAIFGLTYVILDPFGDDALDFPLPAFRAYHASLVDAILRAQQPCPVVIQDGRLTQPRKKTIRRNVAAQAAQSPQAPTLVPPAQTLGRQQLEPRTGRTRQIYDI